MKSRQLIYLLLATYILAALLKNLFNISFFVHYWAVFPVICLCAISSLHGVQLYGWKKFLVFFSVTFVVSWAIESLSIATGFPFSQYCYNSYLGIKLGTVPVVIMLCYFSVGYLSWVMAHVIAGRMNLKYDRWDALLVPTIGGLLMACWDLTFDPYSSTISQLWVWPKSGAFYGVPFANFAGWWLCNFLIYAIFFQFLKRQSDAPSGDVNDRWSWTYPVLGYMVFSVETITKPLRALAGEENDLHPTPSLQENCMELAQNISQFERFDIYKGLALVSILTMVFVSVICLMILYRHPKSEQ